jgi:uracil-DNA glycosylase family 4
MEGFFTQKETESISRPDGKNYSCISCGLHQLCKSPKIKPYGNFKKRILNIGEAPGEMEDNAGKPWQGRTGTLLKETYASLGIDLFEDCLNINAVNCRPEDNRQPNNYEIACCRRIILDVIKHFKPQVIILLGNSAVFSLIGHRWKKSLEGISKWRGWTIPDQDFKAWICPTFHPSYVERSDAKEVTTVWKQDLKKVFSLIGVPKGTDYPLFPEYEEPEIEIIEDLSILNKITKGNITFDYETTGIKPHAEGHRIICASVAYEPNACYTFMMPSTRRERQPFVDLLTNPNVGKIAQNMKFEHAWSQVRLKVEVQNWVWDTMLAAHILDNRPGVTGLKFLTYVHFGIIDYASDVSPYLEASDAGNGNALNNINELLKKPKGVETLLHYCGLDAVYEYRLAMKQQSEILLPF